MHIETRLTTHGWMRLLRRSSLRDVDVEGYISSGLALYAGKEIGSNRVHWALWCEKDNQAVVVVRDEKTKEAITVLNEFHEGRRRISRSLVDLVKKFDKDLKGKPSLREVRISDMQRAGANSSLRLLVILRPIDSGKTFPLGVKISLQEVEDLDHPWRDKEIAAKLWKNMEEYRPFVKSDLMVEQVITRLSETIAYNTVYPQEILQRPSL